MCYNILNMHEGHRKRILERLYGDGENLQDHELLEILLFNAIPRKNTNPVAHALIDAFGSLEGVFSAEIDQLKEVDGVGQSVAEYLKCIGLLFSRVSKSEHVPLSATNLQEFSNILKKRYEDRSTEVVDLFFLDSKCTVKSTYSFNSGDSGKVDVDTGDLNRVLGQHRSEGLVVAHNHPSGICNPSATDDSFTAQLYLLCSANHITLRDHVIVGKNGSYSYFLTGKLETIRHDFNIQKLIAEKRIQ